MKAFPYKSLLLVFLFHLALNTQAQDSGINFFSGTWEEALTASSKEGKLIYLDCYTTWCGPCKKMEAKIYTQTEVAELYNSQFINVRIDMESEVGLELTKKYHVQVYPTHLYLDKEGKVLHRSTGYKIASAFIRLGQEALDPNTRSSKMDEAFQNGQRDLPFIKEYFSFLKKTKQNYQEVFDVYLPELDQLEASERIDLLRRYTRYVDSKSFPLFVEHQEAISNTSSKAEYDFILKEILKNSTAKAASDKNEGLYNKAIQVYKENFPNELGDLQELQLSYYKNSGQFGIYYDSLKVRFENTWLLGKSMEELKADLINYPDSVFFNDTKDEMIIGYFVEKGLGTLNMGDWTQEDGLVAIEYYNSTAGFLTNYTLQFLKAPDSYNYILPELMQWVELSLLIEKNYKSEYAGKYFYYATYAKLAHKNQQTDLAQQYAQKAIDFAETHHFPEDDFKEMSELLGGL